ncbi:MAG TPA: hypothetical protein PKX15_11470, partial [Bacteroidales bacterium]|nr:hypothetical protein [Bacteroidales bacterium]
GSWEREVESIKANPTKVIYTQYKNLLLRSGDADVFKMRDGERLIEAPDIWVIDFSSYKMKDRIDEGLLEFSLSGSGNKMLTLIDDSIYTSKNQNEYQIIQGSLDDPPETATYEGLGLFYPANGIIVLNASRVAEHLGINNGEGIGYGIGDGPVVPHGLWSYRPGKTNDGFFTDSIGYTFNHRTLFISMLLAQRTMKVRKSEYVPARHYFVRVMNRDFNYSNNPTYIYDGTDGIHAKGTIYNTDFINDPKTYITSVGLYNENNELVAVAKLSRPAMKSFDQELLIKVRLDF